MTYRNCTRIKIDDASPMLWLMTASLLNIQPPLRGCAMYFDLGGNKQKMIWFRLSTWLVIYPFKLDCLFQFGNLGIDLMHFHFWLLHATWPHFQCLNTCGNPMPRRLPSLIFHRFSCNLDHLPNPQLSWQQLHRGGWFSGHLGWQLPGWWQQPCNRAAAWCRGVALYTPCVCGLEGYRGGGNLGHSDRRRWKFYGVLATFDVVGCRGVRSLGAWKRLQSVNFSFAR